MSLLARFASRFHDILDYIQTGQTVTYDIYEPEPVEFPPLERRPAPITSRRTASEFIDIEDEGPDCSGKIHRRHCRNFDRDVRDLYWKYPDEVTEPGTYIRTVAAFGHGVSSVIIVSLDGTLVELEKDMDSNYSLLKPNAIYLGPLPDIHKSMWIDDTV